MNNALHSSLPQRNEVEASLVSEFVQNYQRLSDSEKSPIENITTQLAFTSVSDFEIPFTVNETEYSNSYICSIYTAYINYAREELSLIQSFWQRSLFRLLIPIASVYLKWMKINQTVSLNNWLVSTVPTSDRGFNTKVLSQIKSNLIKPYPSHSVSIRCLNEYEAPTLLSSLQQEGWLLLPTRQVYIFPKEKNWWRKNNVKNDQRLLRKEPFIFQESPSLTNSDYERMAHLYRLLYNEKHSELNPKYSSQFLKEMGLLGLINFKVYRDQAHNIVGFFGVFERDQILTTPMLGYDTSLPKSTGLYRLLIAQLLLQAHQEKKTVNLSSGAAGFKTQRGGEGYIEYSAYWVQHLPWYRRWMMKGLSVMMMRFAPKVFASNQL
jgi:hypothetical protein